MRWKPSNPDHSLPSRHTMYLATNGGGKSQALEQNPEIVKAARVIGWDHAGDHRGIHYTDDCKFVDALMRAEARWASHKTPYRIHYAGARGPDPFEWWCEVVIAVLDGRYLTHLIVEELAHVSPSSHRATPTAGLVLNEGRKFGAVFHGTSQRAQEVAKTYYEQCPIKFVGVQNSDAMCRRMAQEVSVTPEQIAALRELQFYKSAGRRGDAELITLKYKKTKGVTFVD